jgi:beta-lactamase superfamily II metal-dependent hydrolase
MILRIFDVEHGACAMLAPTNGAAIAMIDCGHNSSTGWRPSSYLRNQLNRTYLDYLLVTNADQDHLSDLSTLLESGISIGNLISNTWVSPMALRQIKQQSGPITADAEALVSMRQGFAAPGSGIPFNQVMGGIDVHCFFHPYPLFTDTNNLSCVYFVGFGPFKILFPGDLEKEGWRAHLRNPAFAAELQTTTILVSSHHGRDSGFSDEAFRDLKFQAIVISDKSIVHGTQETVPDYRTVVRSEGINVTNCPQRRHVLTTRRDGDIVFRVEADGTYYVTVGA